MSDIEKEVNEIGSIIEQLLRLGYVFRIEGEKIIFRYTGEKEKFEKFNKEALRKTIEILKDNKDKARLYLVDKLARHITGETLH